MLSLRLPLYKNIMSLVPPRPLSKPGAAAVKAPQEWAWAITDPYLGAVEKYGTVKVSDAAQLLELFASKHSGALLLSAHRRDSGARDEMVLQEAWRLRLSTWDVHQRESRYVIGGGDGDCGGADGKALVIPAAFFHLPGAACAHTVCPGVSGQECPRKRSIGLGGGARGC